LSLPNPLAAIHLQALSACWVQKEKIVAGNFAYESSSARVAPIESTTGDTNDDAFLNEYLAEISNQSEPEVYQQESSTSMVSGTPRGYGTQLADFEMSELRENFRTLLGSLTVEEIQSSPAYQAFINRINRREPQVQQSAEVSVPANSSTPAATAGADSQQTQLKIQETLAKADQLLTTDIEASKALYLEAITLADKNYDPAKTVQEIRQLQAALPTNTLDGKSLTQNERMGVHNEILTRIAAAVLPYQLRSGSMQENQRGFASVLRHTEQNAAAEEMLKEAVQKADALPIAEMKKQIDLIAEEMRRVSTEDEMNYLTDFSQNLLGSNEFPGAIKLPIAARKELVEFYIRPSMQQDGTAQMTAPAPDGTPRFIPEHNAVFKPELAQKAADEAAAKYKEIYGIDLATDPGKDMELQVFRATIENNLPEHLQKKLSDRSYALQSSSANLAALTVGLVGTAVLVRFGGSKLAATVMPSLFNGGNAAAGLTGMGKAAEFVTAGTLASVTRNQIMTNVYGRDDETLGLSLANGFGSTLGGRLMFQSSKYMGDKFLFRGFSAEASTARAAKMVGPDGAAQLAKLREFNPGLPIQKNVTTFAEWANGASASERATALGSMAKHLEKRSFLGKVASTPYTVIGQPLSSAETITAGGITARRIFGGAMGGGVGTTVMDASSNYSREWPRLLSGEARDADGNVYAATFENLVIKPIYKSPHENSFVEGMLLGGFFARPGLSLVKPWGETFFSAGTRQSLPGKIWETGWTPVKSTLGTAGGFVSGSTPAWVFSKIAPAGSDAASALRIGYPMAFWQTMKNYGDLEMIDAYDQQLKRNSEALTNKQYVSAAGSRASN